MNILFTTPVLEHPPAGGPQLRIENTIKALSRVGSLYIVSRVSQVMIGGAEAEKFYAGFCEVFRYAPSCRAHAANRYIRKAQRILGELTGLYTKRDTSYLLQCIDKWNIDVVWMGYGNISYPLIKALRKARPHLKLICDTDSVWSRFILRELPYIKNPLRRAQVKRRGAVKETEERAWVALCDVTTGVSDVDCSYYRSLTSKSDKVFQFSNVIDLNNYTSKPSAPADIKNPYVYLAGTFGHANSPMDRAARWMLDDIMPRVREQLPNTHFYIVGSGSDRMLGHETNAHVTVTGKLPSVLPYLCHASVSAVPLQFESGTRFKILEAGACHIPLVSTTLGGEGIPVIDQKHILLADTSEAFAHALVRVLKDRDFAKKLAENCYQLVYAQYSVEALTLEARHIVEKIT